MIEWDLDLNAFVNAGGGLAFIALGLWVASVDRTRPVNRAFAVFAVTFGVPFIVSNLLAEEHPLYIANNLATGPLLLVATAAIIHIAREFPRGSPLSGASSAVAVALGGAILLAGLAVDLPRSAAETSGDLAGTATIASEAASTFVRAGLVLGLWTIALRARATPGLAKELALVTCALALYPAWYATRILIGEVATGEPLSWEPVVLVAQALALALFWLLGRLADPRTARNVALITLLPLPLAASVYATIGGGYYGLARAAGVAILAYAIIRHQILGVDVKLRWTISKSTIAAAFIAVFFVASETAQQFFGETLGSTYVGIAAAGGLVFALAPLQRFADRIATSAIPSAEASTAVASGRTQRREELYRNALRVALKDRRLAREEEVHLHKLAEELGIGAGRAHELLVEAETEKRP